MPKHEGSRRRATMFTLTLTNEEVEIIIHYRYLHLQNSAIGSDKVIGFVLLLW